MPTKNIKNTRRKPKGKTRKNVNQYTEQKIVETFLEMLNTVKLYHWKTNVFAQHKATDDLYGKLNDNIDTFVETMLGKTGSRVNLTRVKSIPLNDYSSVSEFNKKIKQYIQFLINLTIVNGNNNGDLLNIRDELLGNLNQFEYLLTFH